SFYICGFTQPSNQVCPQNEFQRFDSLRAFAFMIMKCVKYFLCVQFRFSRENRCFVPLNTSLHCFSDAHSPKYFSTVKMRKIASLVLLLTGITIVLSVNIIILTKNI
ncbi:hypothetical protein VCUG_02082, partial [Vavraia culicis subsp. floridensis]